MTMRLYYATEAAKLKSFEEFLKLSYQSLFKELCDIRMVVDICVHYHVW